MNEKEHNPYDRPPEFFGDGWRPLKDGEIKSDGDEFNCKDWRCEPEWIPVTKTGTRPITLTEYRRRITPASTPADAPTADATGEAGDLTIRDCIMRRFAGNGTRVGGALAQLQVNEISRADALQIIREEAERMERENFPEQERRIATLTAELAEARKERLQIFDELKTHFESAHGALDMEGLCHPHPDDKCPACFGLKAIERLTVAARSAGTEGRA